MFNPLHSKRPLEREESLAGSRREVPGVSPRQRSNTTQSMFSWAEQSAVVDSAGKMLVAVRGRTNSPIYDRIQRKLRLCGGWESHLTAKPFPRPTDPDPEPFDICGRLAARQ